MMNTRLAATAALVAASGFMLWACGGSDEAKGGQCQACRDSTPRCDSTLTCRGFYNSTTIRELCATPATSSCPAS